MLDTEPSFQQLENVRLRDFTEKQEVQNEEGDETSKQRWVSEGRRSRAKKTKKKQKRVFATRDVPTANFGGDVTTDATGFSLEPHSRKRAAATDVIRWRYESCEYRVLAC